jgi:hypothetical protein
MRIPNRSLSRTSWWPADAGEHRIRLRAAVDGDEPADDVVIIVEPAE